MPMIARKMRSLYASRNGISLFLTVLFSACVLAIASPAHAIVTADKPTSETSPLLESSGDWDINWDYVYKYKGSSAVAISPYWLVTAAHVANDSYSGIFTVNGTTYTPVNTIYHSNTLSQDPNHSVGADLALIRLDNPLPGYYDVYEGAARFKDAVMIGYGYTGSVFDDYYTMNTSTTRIKRWGTNRVDTNSWASYSESGTSWNSEVIRMNFSLTDYNVTPYEAGVATWDSGGGSFVKDPTDDTWKLAGINVYVNSLSAPSSIDAVRLEKYSDWIDNILANPAYFYYPSILGDANKDGVVDTADYTIWADHYTGTGGTGGTWETGDFNFDGAVDSADYTIWADHIGETAGSSIGAVPEPTSISLLVLGGIALIRKRNSFDKR